VAPAVRGTAQPQGAASEPLPLRSQLAASGPSALATPKQSECDELVELITDYFEQMRETSRVTGTLVSAGVPQQRIEALLRAARAFQAERAARQ
jgi:hypothetical protein